MPSAHNFSAIMAAAETPGFTDGMLWNPPSSTRELEAALKRSWNGWKTGGSYTWTMESQHDQCLIGRFSIRLHLPKDNVWSLGYWVHPDFQNQGYATEGAAELIRAGFLEIEAEKIVASHAKWNEASGKVLKKIGMQCIGETEEGFLKHGKWVAEYDYVIFKASYVENL